MNGATPVAETYCRAIASSISAAGKVTPRGPGMENPKLPTGQIEVRVTSMEVLSVSPTPPFVPHETEQVNEERRFFVSREAIERLPPIAWTRS